MISTPVHIVIAVSSYSEKIFQLLHALSKCELPPSFQEVIVVENGTTETLRERVLEFKKFFFVRYRFVARYSKSLALNKAVDSVQNGFAIFLDDDVEIKPDFIMNYARGIVDQDEGKKYFGGEVIPQFEENPSKIILNHVKSYQIEPFSRKKAEEIYGKRGFQFFLGANWGAFVSDIKKIGGFLEHLGPGSQPRLTGEETDIQKRLTNNGLTGEFLDDVSVLHFIEKEKATPQFFLKRRYLIGRTESWNEQHRGMFFHSINWVKYYLRAVLFHSPVKRFQAKYEKVYHAGIINGRRLKIANKCVTGLLKIFGGIFKLPGFKILKNKIYRNTPKSWLLSKHLWQSQERKRWINKHGVECLICGYKTEQFDPHGLVQRNNAKCPACGSLERHRLIWKYLKDELKLFDASKKIKLLHFAPNVVMYKFLPKFSHIEYTPCDLNPENYKHRRGPEIIKVDITDIPFKDETFDFIICSHVLEHVPDDKKAMKEMHRILKKGGGGIMMVPVDYKLEKTYEDFSITDPQERQKAFGQDDHVRIYGRDYPEKLKAAEFQVKGESFARKFSKKATFKYGFKRNHKVYHCEKA